MPKRDYGSCNSPDPIIPQTSGWFLPLFFQMFWYLVEIALKLLSVSNEQPSFLLEDVFIENNIICIRLHPVQWTSSLLPTRIPFWAGYVFPDPHRLMLLCPLGRRLLPLDLHGRGWTELTIKQSSFSSYLQCHNTWDIWKKNTWLKSRSKCPLGSTVRNIAI